MKDYKETAFRWLSHIIVYGGYGLFFCGVIYVLGKDPFISCMRQLTTRFSSHRPASHTKIPRLNSQPKI